MDYSLKEAKKWLQMTLSPYSQSFLVPLVSFASFLVTFQQFVNLCYCGYFLCIFRDLSSICGEFVSLNYFGNFSTICGHFISFWLFLVSLGLFYFFFFCSFCECLWQFCVYIWFLCLFFIFFSWVWSFHVYLLYCVKLLSFFCHDFLSLASFYIIFWLFCKCLGPFKCVE